VASDRLGDDIPPYEQWPHYKVTIRRNSDGATTVYEYSDYDDESIDFAWGEGNLSCDCNRHMDFQRGRGEEVDEEHFPCGHSAYTVLSIVDAAGRVVYREDR
jgi:hypothetical protein